MTNPISAAPPPPAARHDGQAQVATQPQAPVGCAAQPALTRTRLRACTGLRARPTASAQMCRRARTQDVALYALRLQAVHGLLHVGGGVRAKVDQPDVAQLVAAVRDRRRVHRAQLQALALQAHLRPGPGAGGRAVLAGQRARGWGPGSAASWRPWQVANSPVTATVAGNVFEAAPLDILYAAC